MDKKIVSLLLIACLLMPLFQVRSVAASSHSAVSGVISLPGNDTAPSGGVKVKLTIGTDNNTPENKNDDKLVTTEIIIPKGQKSIAYSVQVPKSQNAKAKYYVYYTVEKGYAPFGWYSKEKTTAIKENRTLIDVNGGDVSGVNIELLPGRTISGKIIHGNPSTKPMNDLKFVVTAVQEGPKANSTDDDIIISKEIILKANSSNAPYELVVPINDVNKGYKVYYTYENQGYKETGYFHKNGTSRNGEKVTLIDVANTAENIDLTTLPFTNITGRVYLPNNEKAPKNGIEITITAYNNNVKSSASDDFSFSKTVTIPANSNSADYALTVPVTSTSYIVSYKIVTKNTEYINEGYYNKNGTERDIKNATPVKTGNTNINAVDLELIGKKAGQKPTPVPKSGVDIPKKYDLNEDGYVNIFDLIELAKVIAERYEKEGFNINPDEFKNRKLDMKDLETLWKVFNPFTANHFKIRWFNNHNWFDFDFDDFDCEKFMKEWRKRF
ncbi:S-layer protein [Thermoclostridium stercorarium subsp. leptospartum DSM 9219]|uniref:S-layer protein n=1 Tax=Thermoclostridium stercorarium subsp. leptospartum DSM 9219 TaxID=1346611 RepID=A0A1B1YKG8_THEST|nr:hypothetical protein [Thermoclostridium stercorarium]ANX01212.1 S-layer protein [Thermoclostridium stercorarium subsp. leptospartum DSM 9219]